MRDLSRSITTYFFIFLFSLISAEIIFRIYAATPVFSMENFVKAAVDRHVNPVGPSVIDPTLGWMMRENYSSAKDSEAPLTTGVFGLRMNVPHEIVVPQSGAILAVGDSFTAGSEEGDDGSWPAALERKLQEPVLNGGVGGYGVDQIVLRGRQLAEEFAPKAVIYSFLDEDILRNAFAIYGGYKPYYVIDGQGGLELRGVPVSEVPPQFDRLGFLRGVLGHSRLIHEFMMILSPRSWLGHELQFRQVSTNEEAVQISCLLLDDIKADAERLNFEPFIMLQYGGDRALSGDISWFGKAVSTCAIEKGLPTLDLFEALHAVSVEDLDRFRSLYNERPEGNAGGRFGHMSEVGNEYVADLIAGEFFR
ncbi:hypothetical protein BN1012_Phect2366 [Candidatus Phaeomarinobacter ectocarpi]|uniref:SGNH hydrolase-type esterase domain-containing protein n=1 Tax=Candidatus Phaeomarinibacter ectocarpi TaxID=1458461 RepID=X5MGH4_9HYPH|nr:SGNH/GDSL hydrolase family protein [Candidatus Phaeomarinobacter ectocarpi]CDO60579.1 hypothetical protein BN1012_Phect2366 [Candidatus Phaeomarinobacter ectocarpi]